MKHLYEKIDNFHLSDIKNPTHSSIFSKEETYDVLILSFPIMEEKLSIESFAFVFDEVSYYYFDRKNDEFVNFETMQNVYNFLNEKTNQTMKMVAKFHESIDTIEEKLYDNIRTSNFMHYWLASKKDLARINRSLMLGIDVLDDFIASYSEKEDFLGIHFKDIHEHFERTNRSVLLAIDKLGNLYNFYTSRNNERMNKTIYLLTIFSGIFLPLHFIAGYFGMNTQGLPFGGISDGTSIVTALMVGCAIGMSILILWFRKKL